MFPKVEKVYWNVKKLKIQGAEAVARELVKALALEMQGYHADSRQAFFNKMKKAAVILASARPTEPALRNAMRIMLLQTRKNDSEDVDVLKRAVAREAQVFQKTVAENKKKIALYGSRLIPKDANVLLHCHSSTLVAVLKRAYDDGKKIHAYCCETRPLYQGRVTARELSEYGIKTTLVVDSAANFVLSRMRDNDLVMVGADAITATGELVNKIGTSLIANAADYHGVPFYACAATHKYDPLTLYGVPEVVEERPREEVIEKKLKELRKVNVLNPAFDVTPAKYITGFVTELGVLPPQSLAAAVIREYGFAREELF